MTTQDINEAIPFEEFPKIASQDRSVLSLTNGGYAFCSEEDFDSVSKFSWMHVFDGNQQYAVRAQRGRLVKMHCEIMGAKGIDHKNGDGLDNRRENLRVVNQSQNQMNRGKFAKSHSAFKGVTWHIKDSRWIARIKANGVRINLGAFKSEIEAAEAYDAAAVKYFGEFSRTNRSMGKIA